MSSIDSARLLQDLQELLYARGPGGQEDEVREYCRNRLDDFCDEVSVDELGNVIGTIKGRSAEPGIKLLAHMDENCLYVKRIEPTGKLQVRPIGGIKYWRVGDGPVEVLDDTGGVIPGVLGRGCRHTAEHAPVKASNSGKAATWETSYVDTRLSKDEQARRGIHAGSRVVIARERRKLYRFGDSIGSYFLDDRAGIAVMIAAGEATKKDGPPPTDVRLVCTVMEENGGGAAHALRSVPGLVTVAVDVIPAASEYETEVDETPNIIVRDGLALYTRSVWLALRSAAEKAGTGHRYAALDRIGSDASLYFKSGSVGPIGLVGFSADNTHGYEVCVPGCLVNCAKLLATFALAKGAP